MTERVGVATTDEGIEPAVQRALALADCDGCIGLGAKVLIKPNLHGGEGYTSLAVIEALVHWVRHMGASRVVVGDGPYYGMADMSAYYERIGLTRLAADLGVTLVCFHDADYDEVHTNSPALPETLGTTYWMRWADAVISAPVMKTHFNTLTTLAIKNLKGFLRPRDKREIHQLDLHLAIAALAKLVRPTIHLLDASTAYEGMGPVHGTPVDMGLILASSSAFTLDVVANWLMGFEPARVRYLREAESLGLGRIPLGDEGVAELAGCPLERLRGMRRCFLRPYEAAEASFPNLTISTELACSGCLMNLFVALEALKKEGLAEKLHGTVAIGKAPEEVDLALGACTYAAWDEAPYLSGCPPTIAEITEALRKLVRE